MDLDKIVVPESVRRRAAGLGDAPAKWSPGGEIVVPESIRQRIERDRPPPPPPPEPKTNWGDPEGAPPAPGAAGLGAYPMGRGLTSMMTDPGDPMKAKPIVDRPAPDSERPAVDRYADRGGAPLSEQAFNEIKRSMAAMPRSQREAQTGRRDLPDWMLAGVVEANRQLRLEEQGAATTKTAGPSVDSRADALVRQGMRGDVAQGVAGNEVVGGMTPAKLGQAVPGEFDYGAALRRATDNPIARGGAAAFASLGQTGTGAVRLAADLFGADDVASFAKGAEGIAGSVADGATKDLTGNAKLVADVTHSIGVSLPAVVLGMAGGPALTTLFVQSALAEYGNGRDAGFSIGDSAARGGIYGLAEAVGERFGFSQQIKLLRGAVTGKPPKEMARLLGEMIANEVPGEQLTTAVQFLADKMGPAALHKDATFADYLEQAGETLKLTLAQSAVMGGGPVALSKAVSGAKAADAAIDRSAMTLPERAAADAGFSPTARRTWTTSRLDEFAAEHGLSSKAAQAIKQRAETVPLAALPGFLKRSLGALRARGLFGGPVDDGALAVFDQAPPPQNAAAPARTTPPLDTEKAPTPAAAAPIQGAGDFTGLDAAEVLGAEPAVVGTKVDGTPVIDDGQGRLRTPDGQFSAAPEVPIEGVPDVNQPDLAGTAAQPARAPDGTGDLAGGSGGIPGPVPAQPGPVIPTADPSAVGVRADRAVADGGRPDAALSGRTIGKIGRTPNAAEDVTLRANPDGTLTPHQGKYPVSDFNSGEPVVLPAGTTDAQAIDAIRAAGALSSKDHFYPAQNAAAPDPAAVASPMVSSDPVAVAPGGKVMLDGKEWTVGKVGAKSVSLTSGKTKRTVAKDSPAWGRMAAVPPAAAPTSAPTSEPVKGRGASGTARHPKTIMGSAMLADVSRELGGLDPTWLSEFSSRFETKKTGSDGRPVIQWHNPPISGIGTLFRAGGTQDLQMLAELLEQRGYLPSGSVERDAKAAGERAKTLITAALNKEVVKTEDQKDADLEADREAEAKAHYAEIDAEAAAELEAERQAILAESDIAADRMDATADDDIAWDMQGTTTGTEAMRASGLFTDEEIADAERSEAVQQEGAGEEAGADAAQAARPPAGDRGDAAQPQASQAQEGLTLEAQSAPDLQAKSDREAAASKADAAEQKRLADKTKADAERDEFTLTGSDRPADVAAAAGQGDIFDAPAEPAPVLVELTDDQIIVALDGKLIEQKMTVDGHEVVRRRDAAQALRKLDERRSSLDALLKCLEGSR